jgi:hypothetical protein
VQGLFGDPQHGGYLGALGEYASALGQRLEHFSRDCGDF